jgi:hypothetical protein
MATIEQPKEKKSLFSFFKRKQDNGSDTSSTSKGKGKKGEHSNDIDAKAEETIRKIEQAERNIQGFLVPKHFRYLSKYRNNSFFRLTSLIFLLTLIVGGAQLYKWTVAHNNKKVSEIAQRLELDESSRLQQQASGLRPVKNKFQELEVLRRQLRIPMAPVLDTIEKTIPESISINRIEWLCPPMAASDSLRRRATLRIEVYFPHNIDANDTNLISWPDKMREKIGEYGLKIVQSDWGPEKKFEPTNEQKVKAKDPFGSTRTLSLSVELAGD